LSLAELAGNCAAVFELVEHSYAFTKCGDAERGSDEHDRAHDARLCSSRLRNAQDRRQRLHAVGRVRVMHQLLSAAKLDHRHPLFDAPDQTPMMKHR
jgi:hypothetical protein